MLKRRTRTDPRPDNAPPNPTRWWKLRNDCGLTQRQMADLLGCCIDTIYRMESGKTPVKKAYQFAYRAIAAERGRKVPT